MSKFMLNTSALTETLQQCKECMICFDEYKYTLRKQYNILRSTQKSKEIDLLLLQIRSQIAQIDSILCKLNKIWKQGNTICRIYYETERNINNTIDELNNNNNNSSSNNTNSDVIIPTGDILKPLSSLNFNSKYIPSIFSSHIVAEDWLIRLIEKLNY